jgi:flagellar basal body-associated protein FliL
MENETKINLKQYIPQKASKKFIVQIILYVIAFGIVGLVFYNRFNKKKKEVQAPQEIHNVILDE